MRRVHLTASGRVQGVFFRASARDEARRLGLTGWVRNTADGAVEAEVQGAEDAVASFVEFCRRSPGQSVVDDVAVEDAPVDAGEESFTVR